MTFTAEWHQRVRKRVRQLKKEHPEWKEFSADQVITLYWTTSHMPRAPLICPDCGQNLVTEEGFSFACINKSCTSYYGIGFGVGWENSLDDGNLRRYTVSDPHATDEMERVWAAIIAAVARRKAKEAAK